MAPKSFKRTKPCCCFVLVFLMLTLVVTYFGRSKLSISKLNISYFDRLKFNALETTTENTIEKSTCGAATQNHYRDEFHPVFGDNDTHIFSAYEGINDKDGKRFIRLLAVTNQKENLQKMTCILISNNGTCDKTPANVQTMPESHGARYTASYIFCDVTSTLKILRVAVMTDNSLINEISHFVTVNRDVPKSPASFIHCLAPIQNKYDDVAQFLEFIAVNQMLGVDKFVIYNYSISARINHILTQLQQDGVVEVLQWQLRQRYRSNIHYFGQMLAMNDCLYRKRNHTKFIVNSDLDEFIIPRTSKKWTSFLDPILKKYPNSAIFYIRSFIFCTKLPNHAADFPQKKNAEKYKSLTLLKTNRTVLPLPPNIRQKFIYDPKRVDTVGIHFLWSKPDKYKVIWVAPDECSLNHYRTDLVGTYRKGVHDTFTVDTYMHQSQDDLVGILKRLWDKSTVYLKKYGIDLVI